MNEQEYWLEIESIAETLVNDAMNTESNDREKAEELIYDTELHQTIDSHQWVIYCSYNLDVIKYSDNEEYYLNEFGADSLAASLNDGGLSGLHTAIAFWAMYGDVCEYLSAAFDAYEDE